jgi:acetyl esterase/lipase
VRESVTPVRYGKHRSQVADLWMPPRSPGEVFPAVVLIHGGFWRAVYTKILMNGLARSVNAEGWVAWNVEYRRVGVLGGGGGWPETFDDVAAAVDRLGRTDGVDLDRVVACGHSAGGQLAFWAAGGRQEAEVAVRAAVSLAGILDLEAADRMGLGGDATARFLGGHSEEHPTIYKQASPAALVPLGIPQVLVHGTADEVVPPSMSDDYELSALEAGDQVTHLKLDGVDHRELIDPTGAAWASTLEAIRARL